MNASTVTVTNTPGQALPNTGGFGVEPFTVAGTLLVLLSSGILLAFRSIPMGTVVFVTE